MDWESVAHACPADYVRGAPRLGKHCQEQKHSPFGHQRGNGTRFGEYHAHLPGIIGHFGCGQSQSLYPQVFVKAKILVGFRGFDSFMKEIKNFVEK